MDTLAARFEAYASRRRSRRTRARRGGPDRRVRPRRGMAAAGDALQGIRESSAPESTSDGPSRRWPAACAAATGSGSRAGEHRRPAAQPGGRPRGRAASRDRQRADRLRLRCRRAAAGCRGHARSTRRPGREPTRSRGALGSAIAESLPADSSVPAWWRLVRAWQWLLVAAAVAGLGWLGAIVVSDQLSLLPWVAAAIVSPLLLGWLTSPACMSMVMRAAGRERARAEQGMRSRVVRLRASSCWPRWSRSCPSTTGSARAEDRPRPRLRPGARPGDPRGTGLPPFAAHVRDSGIPDRAEPS